MFLPSLSLCWRLKLVSFSAAQIQCESYWARVCFALSNGTQWCVMYIRSRAFHRWCKHAKISQKWKHQNWIKWAYISLQVSTQESTSVWRKAANHRPIFPSPDFSEQSFLLSWPITGVIFSYTWSLAGFPSMLFHWSRNFEHLAPRAFSFEESCSWYGGHL